MKINLKSFADGLVKHSSALTKSVGKWCSKNAPNLCTGVGLAGMGATMYMVHKSSPKYHKLVEEKEMSKGEKVETALKTYWPSLLSFGASGACIIAGNRISNKRYLALAASASLAQKELMATQESILDTMGPEALNQVKQKVADERNRDKDLTEEDIIDTGKGEELFYEPLTNHYFRSSQNYIESVQNECNAILLSDDTLNVNSWLIDIGVGGCELANGVFWTTYENAKKGLIDVDFAASKVKVKGKDILCWDIIYRNPPKGEYPFPW